MKIMTDSPIRFPGLFGDWAITISSKAIDIGNGIYWYGILIALGMLVALWWCMRQRTKYGIREDDLIDGLLWGIPSAIVGARMYYVLFYLSEFKDHEGHFSWSKAIAIWDGGLAIYGGVIAVVIVAIILCRSEHVAMEPAGFRNYGRCRPALHSDPCGAASDAPRSRHTLLWFSDDPHG